jgi:hypothetical protein
MQTILIGFATRTIAPELPDLDTHRLRDLGVTRAADGTLRLLDDPTIRVAPPRRPMVRGVVRSLSWGRSLLAFLRPSRGLKTVL